MSKNGIPELDKLFYEIETYRETAEFKKLLEFIRKFPKIAPFNAMLLHIQKPGSIYVASTSEWNIKFGRSIKSGANPLVILRPFGPVSFVFDLSDTEGNNPFPDELLNPFGVKGQISNHELEILISNLRCDGIRYNEVNYGSGMAGMVEISEGGNYIKIQKPNEEIWVEVLYDMVMNKNLNLESKFATIIHELGHIYCGHLGAPKNEFNWWENRKFLKPNEREFEAECVCWLICERRGVENPSAAYLNYYLDNNKRIPNISTDTILKAVGDIEAMLKKKKKPRKEIIERVVDLKTSKL